MISVSKTHCLLYKGRIGFAKLYNNQGVVVKSPPESYCKEYFKAVLGYRDKENNSTSDKQITTNR
jgi:hypothetical protein